MAKRPNKRGLGNDPLDRIIPNEKTKGKKIRDERLDSDEKVRMTVHIAESIIEKARDYVWWSPGITLAEFVATAMENELNKIEKRLGRKIEVRKGELTSGRPITK